MMDGKGLVFGQMHRVRREVLCELWDIWSAISGTVDLWEGDDGVPSV
jgi:hypothetical protein